MSVKILMKDPPEPMSAVSIRPLVPVRVAEIRQLFCGGNIARDAEVRHTVSVGDVCVIFDDRQTYSRRIFHGPSGLLVPGYFADYLLFEYAEDVQKIVIAKPENR